MKWFLEQNMIIIMTESAVEKSEREKELIREKGEDDIKLCRNPLLDTAIINNTSNDNNNDNNKDGTDKMTDKFAEKFNLDILEDTNIHLDIKVDPELFRKVEEAVSTIANGTYHMKKY